VYESAEYQECKN